ncbi:MAG: hypothetical protein ACF788_13205 [Novipirellula sp. JB048]
MFSGIESLWGYRRDVDLGCGGCAIGCNQCEPACNTGCSDCDSHPAGVYHGEVYEGEIYEGEIYEGEVYEGEVHYGDPYPSGEAILESPRQRFQPERTRKIFRSKPQVARGVPTPAKR